MARRYDPFDEEYEGIEATKLACYIHSQCGVRLGRGLIASDLIKEIPKVLINIDSNN